MNPDNSKLRHTTRQDLEAEQTHEVTSGSVREFESPEKLIAFDRAQTPVPEAVRDRVAESVRDTPVRKPWWRRLF